MTTWIKRYAEHIKTYTTIRYIIELTLMCFVTKIIFVIIGAIVLSSLGLNTISNSDFEEQLLKSGFLSLTSQLIVFASLETVIGQMLMLWIASKFTKNTLIRILVSASVFAALHVQPMLIVTVFPIGIILAYTYLLYRKKDIITAFLVTTTIHVLHNLIVEWLVFKGFGG